MDDQNEAWRRLTDARLKALEAAVEPARIRRKKDGRPLAPWPYEPGERKPLTKWLELRLLSLEMLFQLMLAADRHRADDLDVDPIECLIELDLDRMDTWAEQQLEPDLSRRETIAMIFLAKIILMEAHTWPLMEMEELGL